MACTRQDLVDLAPRQPYFIGVDSDGCVFDTMGTKQRDYFFPLMVRHWELQAIEALLVETGAFVSLNSRWRGVNRFVNLLRTFEFLAQRPEVVASGVRLPDLGSLRAYVNSGQALGHPSLEEKVRRSGDMELARVLAWSLEINQSIHDTMPSIPPFPHARECLEQMAAGADVMVVSQTPEIALVKEWEQHGLRTRVRAIAGQELGTKTEQIRLATQGKYGQGKVLMVGDAPGDLHAAEEVGACFFPILPGAEAESWERLRLEGLTRFWEGRFDLEYQTACVREFSARLPTDVPWRTLAS